MCEFISTGEGRSPTQSLRHQTLALSRAGFRAEQTRKVTGVDPVVDVYDVCSLGSRQQLATVWGRVSDDDEALGSLPPVLTIRANKAWW